MFFYLANDIKEAEKKVEEEKNINTIVELVTKRMNSGGRGGGNFRGGYWGGGEGFTNNRRRYRNNPY